MTYYLFFPMRSISTSGLNRLVFKAIYPMIFFSLIFVVIFQAGILKHRFIIVVAGLRYIVRCG